MTRLIRLIVAVSAIVFVGGLVGCNTLAGLGQDLGNLGASMTAGSYAAQDGGSHAQR